MSGLFALQLCHAAAVLAADPPRVEQLSNPQSQTIGKKFCGGPPAVWVPMFDPCPGERSPAAVSRPTLPAARSPSRPMLPPFEAVTPMQRDALALFQSGMEARARRDWGLAFKSFHEACLGSNYKRGCGAAVDIWDTHRDDAKRALPNPVSPAFLSIDGCGAGDVLACFTLCAGSIERTAGERPVDAGMVRRQCMDRIQPAEVEAVASYSRARTAEARFARSMPAQAPPPPAQVAAPARLPPAPPSGAALPAPVTALAPPASPPRITSEGNGTAAYWIAEHKRRNYPGTEWIMKALLLEPDNAEAHHLLGEIYARKEWDLDRAVAEAQRATTLDPGNASYWRGLGVVLARAQRRPEALRALQKSKELEPADPKTQLELGRVLCAAGRRQEAISAFETALDRQPELPQALDDYNRCRSRLGLAALKSYPPRAAVARP